MRVVAVDPGITGALAYLSGDDDLDVVDMPTFGKDISGWGISNMLAVWGQVHKVVIEQAHPMPRQGVTSSFNYGVGFGVIVGVCAALNRPVETVSAAKWTRWHKVGADKNLHRLRASQLFPNHAHLFARKRDDGRADAALIAAYAAGTPANNTQETTR